MTSKNQIIKIQNTAELNIPIIAKLKGTVVKGFARGRLLGFPTANLELVDKLMTLPPQGVYTSLVKILDKKYKDQYYLASCNLGKALTFGSTIITIEPHLLDFKDDIYGQTLEVYLHPMQKFEDKSALVKQLGLDVNNVRDFYQQQN